MLHWSHRIGDCLRCPSELQAQDQAEDTLRLEEIPLENPFVHSLLVPIHRRSHFCGPTILFYPFYPH